MWGQRCGHVSARVDRLSPSDVDLAVHCTVTQTPVVISVVLWSGGSISKSPRGDALTQRVFDVSDVSSAIRQIRRTTNLTLTRRKVVVTAWDPLITLPEFLPGFVTCRLIRMSILRDKMSTRMLACCLGQTEKRGKANRMVLG